MTADDATTQRRWTDGPIGMAVRFALVVVGLLLLWAAKGRYEDFREAVVTTFRPDVTLWIAYVALVTLAGAVFGVGAVLPARVRGYRWVRTLVLAAVPVTLVVLSAVVLVPDLYQRFPEWWQALVLIPDVVSVAAAMVGFALAAGFADQRTG